jgi:hypothetical protein
VIYWAFKAFSRAEGFYKILKAELGSARGNLKGVIKKFRNLLRRLYREIINGIQFESTKYVPRFSPNL